MLGHLRLCGRVALAGAQRRVLPAALRDSKSIIGETPHRRRARAGAGRARRRTERHTRVADRGRDFRTRSISSCNGGGGLISPTHRLKVRMTTNRTSIITDVTTGRVEAEITGIDATFTLTELATGKAVMQRADLLARVVRLSGPATALRARARAPRRREPRRQGDRRERSAPALASYFVAGTAPDQMVALKNGRHRIFRRASRSVAFCRAGVRARCRPRERARRRDRTRIGRRPERSLCAGAARWRRAGIRSGPAGRRGDDRAAVRRPPRHPRARRKPQHRAGGRERPRRDAAAIAAS